MRKFMDDNFLLSTDTAVTLYHDFAKEMPICDYHCHLNPKEIAEDKRYKNITEIWLGGDHYKWRTMRSFGIEEKYSVLVVEFFKSLVERKNIWR